MKAKLLLDGTVLRSEADLHDEVFKQLELPFYGRNLDALWDVVVEMIEPPIEIKWINASESQVILGDRFPDFLSIFEDAKNEYSAGDYRFVLEM
jgi:ribonuclease inhibitor